MAKEVKSSNKDLNDFLKALKNKNKFVALLAPSFVAEFEYPKIILQLKKLGFDKVVELTFGAKMINRDYHKILENSKNFKISSVCPGIVQTIKSQFPQFEENLIPVDSPMIATGKICKKFYPKHKIVFLSPCHFKKIEAKNSSFIDYVLDYQELNSLLEQKNLVDVPVEHYHFDKFYNDYTKIYPLTGGLSKTAHLKGVIKKNETKIIDGISNVEKYLKKPDKKIRFLDVNFCVGGCIGGPCLSKTLSLDKKHKKVLDYLELSKHEDIPETKKGLIDKAKGISFLK